MDALDSLDPYIIALDAINSIEFNDDVLDEISLKTKMQQIFDAQITSLQERGGLLEQVKLRAERLFNSEIDAVIQTVLADKSTLSSDAVTAKYLDRYELLRSLSTREGYPILNSNDAVLQTMYHSLRLTKPNVNFAVIEC